MFYPLAMLATGFVFGSLYSLADAMNAGMAAEAAAQSFWSTMTVAGILIAGAVIFSFIRAIVRDELARH